MAAAREHRTRWEHAVLRIVATSSSAPDGWVFSAIAWVGEAEIYNKTITTMYWSHPLADLGSDGWELVTVLGPGISSLTSPTVFFLKRRCN